MKKSLGSQTLLQPTPILLVGTYDEDEKPNMMCAAWGGICSSKPVCFNVSLRAATYSHAAIVARKAFTLGVPSVSQVKEADYMGMVSGRDVDKFTEVGWTAVKSDLVDAPYAEELPFVAECKLIETVELGLHTMFVGEVADIKVDKSILGENGTIDIKAFNPISFAPVTRKYYGIGDFAGDAFSVGKR